MVLGSKHLTEFQPRGIDSIRCRTFESALGMRYVSELTKSPLTRSAQAKTSHPNDLVAVVAHQG